MSDQLLGGDPGDANQKQEPDQQQQQQQQQAPDPNEPAPEKSNLPEFLQNSELAGQLDQETLNDPSLKPIKDIPNLVKSFVNAQKQMGKDKVTLPTKNSGPEEWDTFFQKLGKPESPDKYELPVEEGDTYSEDFVKKFKEAAHKNNVLPDQAKNIFESIKEQEKQEDETYVNQQKEKLEQEVGNLKKEWGNQLNTNLQIAQEGAKQFGGDEFLGYLKSSGLGNNPQLVRFLYSIGKTVQSEDSSGKGKGGENGYGHTPDEARKEYNKIIADKDDPYNNGRHPNHKDRVEEVSKLFAAMNQKQ